MLFMLSGQDGLPCTQGSMRITFPDPVVSLKVECPSQVREKERPNDMRILLGGLPAGYLLPSMLWDNNFTVK